MRSLHMVHGKPQVVCAFDAPMLSKTARRNLARRKVRKDRRSSAVTPVTTSNTFEVLSDQEDVQAPSAIVKSLQQQQNPLRSPRKTEREDRVSDQPQSIRQRLRSTIELVKNRGLNPYTQRKARDTLSHIHGERVDQPQAPSHLYRPVQTGQYKNRERKWEASTSRQRGTPTAVRSVPPSGRSAPIVHIPQQQSSNHVSYTHRRAESRSVAQPQKIAPAQKQSKAWTKKASSPPPQPKGERSSPKLTTIPGHIDIAPMSLDTSVQWRRRSDVEKERKEKEKEIEEERELLENTYQMSEFDEDDDDLLLDEYVPMETVSMVHHVRMVGVVHSNEEEEGEFVEDSHSPRIGLGARAAAAALKQKDEQIALLQRQMLELTQSMSILMGQNKKPEKLDDPSGSHSDSSEPNPE